LAGKKNIDPETKRAKARMRPTEDNGMNYPLSKAMREAERSGKMYA
jgi:hypothetical protein